jgi:hypothetical protein
MLYSLSDTKERNSKKCGRVGVMVLTHNLSFIRRNEMDIRMVILSTDPGIHGYPVQWVRVWRVDYVHGFHGVNIQ